MRIHSEQIEHDLPSGENVRLFLSSPDVPYQALPQRDIGIRRRGLIGICTTSTHLGSGEASLDIVLHQGREVLRNRALPLSGDPEIRWYEIDRGADGASLAITLSGTGTVTLGEIEVILPSPVGIHPVNRRLLVSLLDARFPSFPLGWANLGSDSRMEDDRRLVLRGVPVDLNKSVDWKAYGSSPRSWQLLFHGFGFVDLVLSHERFAHEAGYQWLAELLIDWFHANPYRYHSSTDMTWNDMSVSYRALALMHVIERLRFQTEPGYQRLEQLVEILSVHASWLAHERNQSVGHDHAAFSATALAYAGRVLRHHPRALAWRQRAADVFGATLGALVEPSEGTILEHSPAYDAAVAQLTRQRREDGLRDSMPPSIVDKLEKNLGWLTTPQGRLAPIGDTAHDHASPQPRPRGWVAHERTGWAAIQSEGASVFLVAGFHSQAHKHADDLSVLWYEDGRPILIEAGLPGYETTSDERSHAVSPKAHNVVLIDDRHPVGDEPYGSGIVGGASEKGWTVLGASIDFSHGRHSRHVLYRERLLILIDEVRVDVGRRVTRLLHLADDVLPKRAGSEVEMVCDGTVCGHLTSQFHGSDTQLEIHPKRSGNMGRHYPSLGERRHHPVLELTDSGPGTRLTAISWNSSLPNLRIESNDEAGDDLELTIGEERVWLGVIDGHLVIDSSQPP